MLAQPIGMLHVPGTGKRRRELSLSLDTWVQCDECDQWRRIAADLVPTGDAPCAISAAPNRAWRSEVVHFDLSSPAQVETRAERRLRGV